MQPPEHARGLTFLGKRRDPALQLSWESSGELQEGVPSLRPSPRRCLRQLERTVAGEAGVERGWHALQGSGCRSRRLPLRHSARCSWLQTQVACSGDSEMLGASGSAFSEGGRVGLRLSEAAFVGERRSRPGALLGLRLASAGSIRGPSAPVLSGERVCNLKIRDSEGDSTCLSFKAPSHGNLVHFCWKSAKAKNARSRSLFLTAFSQPPEEALRLPHNVHLT